MKYISVGALVWVLIEAIALSSFGTTPGKYLLQIYVCRHDDQKLSFKDAVKRSLMVWGIGNGCGIVYVNWLAPLFSYYCLKKNKSTWYDEHGQYKVINKKIGWLRAIIFILLQIGMTALALMIMKRAL